MTEVVKKPEVAEAVPSSEMKIELAPAQMTEVSEVLSRLFTQEEAKLPPSSLADWGRKIEESLNRNEEGFETRLRAMIEDSKLFDDPELSEKIRSWLRDRMNAVVLTSVSETRSERVGMLQGLRSGQQAETAPQTEKPPGSPPEVVPSAQPVITPGETAPQAATSPETKPTEPPKESAAAFQAKLRREASSGGLMETFGKAMAALASLMENFKDWDPFKALGLSTKTPETEEKKSTGVRFTEEELAKLAFDAEKNMDRVYPGQDKAVEYVAAALNLPPRETPQIFLDSLTDSGMVYVESIDRMQEIEPGDILFFKKADDKGEFFAYTCAVVTNKEPLKMRLVPDGGGAPQEIADAKESDYFKNSRYGFVKTKRDAPTQ